MTQSFPEDSSIYLGRLMGHIEHHGLGADFMSVLYEIVLEKPIGSGASAAEMWIVSKSRTEQRIKAAERVLQANVVDISAINLNQNT